MRREFREKEQPEFTMNKEKNERHRQREREGGEINDDQQIHFFGMMENTHTHRVTHTFWAVVNLELQ